MHQSAAAPEITGAGGHGYRLSIQQAELWQLSVTFPHLRAQCVVSFDGPLDEARLRAAVAEVVARHEALRTVYPPFPGLRVPLQVIFDDLEAAWDETTPLDAAQGPVLSVTRIDDGSGVRLTTLPMTSDAAGLAIVASEIAALCAGGSANTAVLGEDPLQYADFAEWQHEVLASAGADADEARAHWETLASSAPQPPTLPFERRPAPEAAFDVARVALDPPSGVAAASAALGTDATTFLTTCWAGLIARLTGDGQVLLAVVSDGRHHAEQAGAVGAYARALPVTIALDPEIAIDGAVAAVSRAIADAREAEDWYAGGSAGPAHAVSYVVCADPASRATGPTGRFTAEVAWREEGGELAGDLVYDVTAFSASAAARLATLLDRFVSRAVADPTVPLGLADLLDEVDHRQVVERFNDTGSQHAPTGAFHEIFEAQAARTPEAPAVRAGAETISYGDLNRRANQLASVLRANGVCNGAPVGLLTDRSFDTIIGLLGILKAGGAYLPLNLEHPPSRIAHLLGETRAPAVVTQSGLLAQISDFPGHITCLDRDEATLAATPGDVSGGATADDLVYVMYTSGSTGLPKGVAVTHGNLVAYTRFIIDLLGADTAPLEFAMVSAISTDLGNTTIFPALASGGCLNLISPEAALDGALYAEEAVAHPIDVLKITPSHLAALLAGPEPAAILPRHTLLIGGETLTWDLVEWIRSLGTCRILNHYGPTETCVGCCTFDTAEAESLEWRPATVPVGRPIAGATVHVLDGGLHPVPVGVVGELCVGGAGVAQGYWENDDLTAKSFVADPFRAGGRLYRTGDRARFLPDGSVEFLGRADGQVKIRGYRVETAEIEAVFRHHPTVQQAAVVARQDRQGQLRLAGYFVAAGATVPSEESLRSFLLERLPGYMVPSTLVRLDSMPLTPNGKLDRAALPAPEDAAAGGRRQLVAPSDDVEATIADIWASLLGLDAVSVHEDFFELGGHSLLATQVIARFRNAFGVQLPVHSLFTNPTVARLAALVHGERKAAADDDDEEMARLLAELEGLSDEEAEQLLAIEFGSAEGAA